MNSTFFEKYSVEQRKQLIEKEIIAVLQLYGGKASKRQIIERIIETSSEIDEHYFELVKVSKKTGSEYRPYLYDLNFSIKNLKLAGYVTGNYRQFDLTEKGLQVDPNQLEIENIQEEKNYENGSITEIDELADDRNIGLIELDWRNRLLNALHNMHPKRFELFARRLIKEMGVEIDNSIGVTYVGDGGLDGFGYVRGDDFRTTRVAIQAKRYAATNKVSAPEIDRFRGAMDKFNAEFGIFITTSSFTKEAIQASRVGTRVITLINGEDIADLVEKYQLYVKPIVTYELDEFYFIKD